MSHETLHVIGIGDDGPAGLTPAAAMRVASAAVLVGGRRQLDFFPASRGPRILIDADRDRWLNELRDVYRQKKTVVLASGDPLFYGVGRLLLDFLPREDLVFVPHVSAVQLAFARLKETWNDAEIVSLHGRPLECLLPVVQQRPAKVAILTDAKNDPAAIARFLLEQGAAEGVDVCVCENLGSHEERLTRAQPGDIAGRSFSPLNVVVLLRKDVSGNERSTSRWPLLGLPEDSLQHRGDPAGGMITKREVRVISLAYLELHEGDVFWDIGAGSGSVAIEAARLSPNVRVFAIERDPAAALHIEENCKSLGLTRVAVIRGAAPESLAELPDADAVFIGGSGGRLREILEVVERRLRPGGRLVLNCITLETFSRAWDWLRDHGWQPTATSVQLAHSRPLGNLTCLEPEKPITIVRARRPS